MSKPVIHDFEDQGGFVYHYGAELDFVNPELRKTKAEFPYSYSPFYIWRDQSVQRFIENAYRTKTITTGQFDNVYTDRITEWGHKEQISSIRKELGLVDHDYAWAQLRQPHADMLMSKYLGRNVVVYALAEYCQQNGYPHWNILYCNKELLK